MTHVTAGGQVDACGLCYHRKLSSFLWSMLVSMACAAIRGHVKVHGQCCHYQRPWWYLFSAIPLKAMWMLMVCTTASNPLVSVLCITARGQVDIHGLCCHIKSCWCPWPLLPPEAILMFLACTPNKGRTMLMSIVCTATLEHAEICGPY